VGVFQQPAQESDVSRNNQASFSPKMADRIETPLVVLNACHPGAWLRVGGVPLVARTLFHLNQLGMERVVLLFTTERIPEDFKAWRKNFRIEPLRVTENIPATLLTLKDPGPSLVYIDAAHLMDPRLIRALTAASQPTLAYIDPPDRQRETIRAGILRREDLQTWLKQGKGDLIRQAGSLLPEDIDPFSPEIRGPLPPYFVEVLSKEDARRATSVVIRSQQKQVMDLPAQFIDPPLENLLTRLLCNTPVTPNMVTLGGLAVAAGVAWLFLQGYFLAGAFGMLAVEILDGVDGKLARTKLHFTKLGHREGVIDYVYENGWYAALAVGLSRTGSGPLPALLAGLLILSDTADNIFYTLAGKWHGKSIDLFTPFDSAFRRIAGRRNIYGAMFIIGFFLGYPLHTFAAASLWAAVTAFVHGLRLFQFGGDVKKRTRASAEANR
jgi:phosphatidylglycerophosphate synthase